MRSNFKCMSVLYRYPYEIIYRDMNAQLATKNWWNHGHSYFILEKITGSAYPSRPNWDANQGLPIFVSNALTLRLTGKFSTVCWTSPRCSTDLHDHCPPTHSTWRLLINDSQAGSLSKTKAVEIKIRLEVNLKWCPTVLLYHLVTSDSSKWIMEVKCHSFHFGQYSLFHGGIKFGAPCVIGPQHLHFNDNLSKRTASDTYWMLSVPAFHMQTNFSGDITHSTW